MNHQQQKQLDIVKSMHSLTAVSEERNIFLDLLEDQVYNKLDYYTLEEIYNKILYLSSEKYDSLIVLDNMTSELKNPHLLHPFNTIINNRLTVTHKCLYLSSGIQQHPT